MSRALTPQEAEHAPFRGCSSIRVVGIEPNDYEPDLLVEVTPSRDLQVYPFEGYGALIMSPLRPGEGVFVHADIEPDIADWMMHWLAWQAEDSVAEAEELVGMELGVQPLDPPPTKVLAGVPMLWEEAILNGFPREDDARFLLGERADGSTVVFLVGVSYAE